MYSKAFLCSVEADFFPTERNLESVDVHEANSRFQTGLLRQEDLVEKDLINLSSTLNYITSRKRKCLGFMDVEDTIIETNRLIMNGLHDRNGKFSTKMRFTTHVHPQFADSKFTHTAMQTLCDVVNLIQSEIQGLTDPSEKLMLRCQLASLFFCTFVEIHPFSDGNGRTATILANYLLDLPFFVVIEEDRETYISMLEKARPTQSQDSSFICSEQESIDLVYTILKKCKAENICQCLVHTLRSLMNDKTLSKSSE